jgi:3-oxoacyl-[acyl-carrier protein] reductase
MSRRVLITGGASGIGAATVARFQEDGCRVAALDVDEAMLAQSSADVKVVCDVSDDASVAAAVEQAVSDFAKTVPATGAK